MMLLLLLPLLRSLLLHCSLAVLIEQLRKLRPIKVVVWLGES